MALHGTGCRARAPVSQTPTSRESVLFLFFGSRFQPDPSYVGLVTNVVA